MQPTRRRYLASAAGVLAGLGAGCVDGVGKLPEPEQEDAVHAAFYTLEQFAAAVAGDALAVENPVPVGQLGHHYEVSTQAQLDVARSRAFVYVDLPGFQRWAVDTAANLRNNHPEVALIDAVRDVELHNAGHDHGEGDHGGDHAGSGNESGEYHDGDDGAHDEHDGGGSGGDGSDGGGSGGGHDHGDFDPHFWLDPAKAATCVETVRDRLIAADEGNADTYESNAADFLAGLEDLDETFRTELADRDLETVVVASHDSFGYLADRYSFAVHSPVGVSPNAEPGSAAIGETIDVVDDLGADVVLYDAFESPDLAETVVADSTAERAMALSSVAGTTREWHDRGWGYVEQMREVNLPALKAALGAT
jgi:zinc transport system substrate-binding protein